MKQVLIIGGGPVGLSAALFLSNIENIKITIIEKQNQLNSHVLSKALNINARTISLFHGSNVQKNILSLSYQVNDIKIFNEDKQILHQKIAQILQHKTPFSNFYLLPQTKTQEIIQQELNSTYNLKVQRGCQAVNVKNIENNKVEVVIKKKSKLGEEESLIQIYDIVLAADGSHSSIRKKLGLKFGGQTLKQKLYLCDVTVSNVQLNSFDIYLQGYKRVILIPISKKIARIVGNCKDYMTIVRKKFQIETIEWENEFIINNRVIQHMNIGNIYFAGDSAHVHAPIGGRGMNMGIQDVFIFSKLLQKNQLQMYSEIRLPKIRASVKRISSLSHRILSNDSIVAKMMLPMILYFAKNKMITELAIFASGLDYDIPFLPRL